MPSSSSWVTCSGLRRSARMPGVHGGVQRLHPAVQALGEAGDLLDRGDRDAGLGDPARGRAGAHQLDAGGGEAGGQLLDAGLVVDAEQRAADGDAVGHRELFLFSDGGRPAPPPSAPGARAPRALIRSCRRASSSPGRTATSRWASTGPVSTPASTTCTVAPVTGAPGGQGVADGVRPGERRQQRGVGVDQPAAERARATAGPTIFMKPGRDDQVRVGARRARRPARGPTRRGRGGRAPRTRRWAGRGGGRAPAPAASRSLPTATTVGRVAGVVGRGQQGGAQRARPGEQDGDPRPLGGQRCGHARDPIRTPSSSRLAARREPLEAAVQPSDRQRATVAATRRRSRSARPPRCPSPAAGAPTWARPPSPRDAAGDPRRATPLTTPSSTPASEPGQAGDHRSAVRRRRTSGRPCGRRRARRSPAPPATRRRSAARPGCRAARPAAAARARRRG